TWIGQLKSGEDATNRASSYCEAALLSEFRPSRRLISGSACGAGISPESEHMSMAVDHSPLPSSVAGMAALGPLFGAHRPRLLAMLERRIDPRLKVRLDAQEVLSEAFLLAGRKWADFKTQARISPYAWLYRLALDCLFEAWRREARACRDLRKELP